MIKAVVRFDSGLFQPRKDDIKSSKESYSNAVW